MVSVTTSCGSEECSLGVDQSPAEFCRAVCHRITNAGVRPEDMVVPHEECLSDCVTSCAEALSEKYFADDDCPCSGHEEWICISRTPAATEPCSSDGCPDGAVTYACVSSGSGWPAQCGGC